MSAFVSKGEKSENVKQIQELLCLVGHETPIDGEFGPATELLVTQFQRQVSAPQVNGVMDGFTYDALRKRTGLDMAINPPRSLVALSLGETIKNLAVWHASFHPREVGGDNKGPWVRYYMDGDEGLPWCGGFVTAILKQAKELTGQLLPVTGHRACVQIAVQAKAAGVFVKGEDIKTPIPVGSIFLNRKKDKPEWWEHTGIVIAADLERNVIKTVEGNTNDSGSREGFEVCVRTRVLNTRDYAIIA